MTDRLIITATGHRPGKLGGYSAMLDERLKQFAIEEIRSLSPTEMVSGMSGGWDTAVAEACIELDIPFTAAVPFRGQDAVWPAAARVRYRRLLSKANRVIEVCDPQYAAWKMMRRNVWMVDRCDAVLALWDGSDGGTGNCVAYAKARQKPVMNVWKGWLKWEMAA